MTEPKSSNQDAGAMKALLLADLEHFGESMWRNEEVGEKRFGFFLTIITAVAGGLVALASSEGRLSAPELQLLRDMSILALLLIGELTYLRMVQRNRVTDEYQDTLTYIRNRYVSLCPGAGEYSVPEGRGKRKSLLQQVFKAGYVETIGTINSALIAAGLLLSLQWAPGAAAGAGGVAMMLHWLPAVLRKWK